MVKSTYFQVADHIIEVISPTNLNIMEQLPSFEDFHYTTSADQKPSTKIAISISNEAAPSGQGELIVHADKSDTWGEGFLFEESPSHYITTMHETESNEKTVMFSTKDFSQSVLYLGNAKKEQYSLISWFIMAAFGQGILAYKTVMIHASVVENEQNEAYAFLGKSGTGKSTHSQLWLKYLDNFELLNDDNPILRITENREVYIYGTPWSGKTPCYKNRKAKLKGLVRLQQEKYNQFQLKKNTEALLLLLPSCTAIRWNKKIFNHMVDNIQEVVSIVPIGLMDCKIDKEAAEVSYHGIKNKSVAL